MKKSAIILGLLAALAGTGFWYVNASRHAGLSERALTFAPMTRGPMRDVVSATGVLETRDIVVVGSELVGAVHTLYAKTNDTVVEGTTLATLDDRRIRIKIDEAEDNIRLAKAAMAHAEALRSSAEATLKYQIDLEKKTGVRGDKDQAESQLKAAGASTLNAEAKWKAAETGLKEAQLALDMIHIRVPVISALGPKRDFLILDRKAAVGQLVGPQTGPLFTLAGDLSRMEAHAYVAEGDINKVRKGLPAVFTINGFNDEDIEFRGVVREIRPLANNVKGAVTYDTIIELENQKDPASGEWRLRPGMTAALDIIRREHKDVWRVPSQALNFRLEDAYLTPAIVARLAEWKQRPDAGEWAPVWTWNEGNRSVWPLFVRILGQGPNGEPGLKDSEGNEVLEWESGPPGTPPRLIINAPRAKPPGLFDSPNNMKFS